jgi:hypothetical protein
MAKSLLAIALGLIGGVLVGYLASVMGLACALWKHVKDCYRVEVMVRWLRRATRRPAPRPA